ncbi:DUF899 family protein [Pseudoruegeria sp. HB172150]|uniref:DUF899 family protein n=1 Tax=Pseudoruegeria sp. HB172150 TaxID=2721164 RepID=UPI00155709D7|nr:DUF899 family protein [Pseudoruegeria sp. HB172150]
MNEHPKLEPAEALAARNPIRHPGESKEYRKARQALLVKEYELRRVTEAVAAQRRSLPPGAEVKTYEFEGEHGPTTLADMFGSYDTLIVYSYMFGPQRERPCPMCSSLMAASAPRIGSIRQNVAIAFVARSPIDRLVAAKTDLGMLQLPVFSDLTGDYTRDWVHPEDADVPGLNVFRMDGETVRHFWSGEMTEADPGQDPRSAPEVDPLWHYLDMTPQGRRPDWYPSLAEIG